jgi:hypothetical protein
MYLGLGKEYHIPIRRTRCVAGDCYQKPRTRYRERAAPAAAKKLKKPQKIRFSVNSHGFFRAEGIEPLNYFKEIIKMPNKVDRLDLRL